MMEILSEKAATYAARKYESALPSLKGRGAEVSAMVDQLAGDEKALMEYLYGTMPFRDAVDYGSELFYSYVKHGIFLRKNCPWTRELSEEMFLDYVLFHRVNNEAVTDCRGWFYEMLWPVAEGCSLEEAVKEVNYWCAAQASYAASDQRTLSPAAVFFSGSGRCGEESTFLVTALRSIGIAARQVYAPRWAHCDDNHAWVEAWVDGRWHFLGACEPEEVLDKGWFTNASSRAMLVHTRVFSDYFLTASGIGSDACRGEAKDREPEVTERDGAAFLLNVTDTYARTSPLGVLVKDEEGNPVSRARVSFELLNGAEYSQIARLYTDGEGKVSLTLGLGTVLLCVAKGKYYREVLVENGRPGPVEVILSEGWDGQQEAERQQEPERRQEPEEDRDPKWQYIDHKAPRDFPMHPVVLTDEQKARGRERKQEAERQRREKLKKFDEQAEHLAGKLSGAVSAGNILKAARGNAPGIYGFLKKYPGEEALRFLSVLAPKDYRDIRPELLEEHFTWGQQVREFCFRQYLEGEEQPEELFLQYVWNPRIGYEEITPYRSFLSNLLTEEQKRIFGREPEKIREWIRGDAREMALCKEKDEKVLFVALCRTLGIPARLHPATKEAEYYRGHKFCKALGPEKEEKQIRLVLTCEEKPEYFASWTIGRLVREPGEDIAEPDKKDAVRTGRKVMAEPGEYYKRFETLDLSGIGFEDGRLSLLLPEGIYRLVTTVRLPDGNQLEARRLLKPEDFLPGEDGKPVCVLPLNIRRPKLSQMVEALMLDGFSLEGENGEKVTDGEVTGESFALLAFLEEGAEPTEHFLNELIERQQEAAGSGLKIVFAVRGKGALEQPTLRKAAGLLGAQVYYDDFRELPEQMARRMYTDPEKLPLVLLIGPGRVGRYACSGYNVGSVGLLFRIADRIKNETV